MKKKELCTFAIIAMFLMILFGILFWHREEQDEWRRWKRRIFAIDKAQDYKEAEMGRKMTIDEYSLFVDSIKISRNIVEPKKCPYCFINDYINNYYGSEE